MGFMEGGNMIYVNVSCGFLQNKKANPPIKSRAFTGFLLSLDRQADDYEGKEIMKIAIKMKDDKTNELVMIKFTEDTWFSFSFFARLQNIDLEKAFTLGVSGSDDNEKMSFCWMRQAGKKIEQVEMLKPEKVKVGNNEVYDWGPFLEVIAGLMIDINSKTTGPVKDVSEPESDANPHAAADELPIEDDLPF